MNWFGKKAPVEPILTLEQVEARKLEALQEAELQERKSSWLKAASNAELLDTFSKLELTVKGVTQNVKNLGAEESEAWQKAQDGLAQIHRFWFDIDRNLLTEEQAVKMFDIINTQLPRHIGGYAADSLNLGMTRAWAGYRDFGLSCRFNEILISISNIRNMQTAGLAVKNIPVSAGEVVVIMFPKFSTDNKNISSTLFRTSELWRQASERKNSIEDEYFLEQVASSYLPEAWKLFETFRFAPDESKTAAEKIFMEQLGLIENHIVYILKNAMAQSLVAMRSQVGFLKVKTAIPEESSLTLKAIEVG